MRYILFAFLLLLCFQGYGQSVNITNTGGGGGVSSVGLTVPAGFGVTGSPVTSSGTLGITTTLNGPVRGTGTGLTVGNLNLASEVTGVLPVANGGTGTGTALTQGSVVFAGAGGVLSQDNNNFYWDDTNNRLSVGSSAPQYNLDLFNTTFGYRHTATTRVFELSSGTLYHTFGSGATIGQYYQFPSTNLYSLFARSSTSLRLGANDSEAMRINTDLNIGIGTQSPTQRLHVSGNIFSDGTNAQFLGDDVVNSVSTPTYSFSGDVNTGIYRPGTERLGFVTNGSEKMRIDSLGNVGIGTIPSVRLALNSLSEQLRLEYNASNYSSFTTTSTGNLTIGTTGTFIKYGTSAVPRRLEINDHLKIYQTGADPAVENVANQDAHFIGSISITNSPHYALNLGNRPGTGHNHSSQTGGNVRIVGDALMPALSSGNFNSLILSERINTSNTATGIVTSLSISPTITQLPTGGYRAIDVAANNANGYGIYQSGSLLKNYINGATGFGTTSPTNTVDVNGTARIRTFTGTPKRIIGANYDGVLDTLVIGSGLSLTSGTLNTALTIDAGTWTPGINYAATGDTLTVLAASYTRLGTVVTYTIKAELQISTSNDITTYYIGLPVASNFTSINDASGTITRHRTGSVTQGENVDGLHKRLRADTGNDRLELQLDNSDNLNTTVTITGQYIIK